MVRADRGSSAPSGPMVSRSPAGDAATPTPNPAPPPRSGGPTPLDRSLDGNPGGDPTQPTGPAAPPDPVSPRPIGLQPPLASSEPGLDLLPADVAGPGPDPEATTVAADPIPGPVSPVVADRSSVPASPRSAIGPSPVDPARRPGLLGQPIRPGALGQPIRLDRLDDPVGRNRVDRVDPNQGIGPGPVLGPPVDRSEVQPVDGDPAPTVDRGPFTPSSPGRPASDRANAAEGPFGSSPVSGFEVQRAPELGGTTSTGPGGTDSADTADPGGSGGRSESDERQELADEIYRRVSRRLRMEMHVELERKGGIGGAW